METHRRLAPCPAALEDGKLGPSTGIEGEIEDRRGPRSESGGRKLFSFCHFCLFTCVAQCDFYIHVTCCLSRDIFCTLAFFEGGGRFLIQYGKNVQHIDGVLVCKCKTSGGFLFSFFPGINLSNL